MTQQIAIFSDLHLEFSYLHLPVTENESKTILVLAGDVGIASKPSTFGPFITEMSERFQDVVYVLGNHEHYYGSINRSIDKIRSELHYIGGIHNVHILEDDLVRINDITFIGSTLWTSFDRGNPLTMNSVEHTMNDYKIIRCGSTADPYARKFKPNQAYYTFLNSINYIFPTIEKEKEKGQKVVVVTHMAPSLQSIAPQFRTGALSDNNGAYASDLDHDIMEAKPDVMIHGHTHVSFDYNIGETRILCNPRGYVTDNPKDLNPDFDPTFTIDL